MSIVNHLIKSVCAHEAGHAIVAKARGAVIGHVDVFGINWSNSSDKPNSVGYWADHLSPLDRAIIAISGEMGEILLNVQKDYQSPVLWQALNKSRIPKPGDWCFPHILPDVRKFVLCARELGRSDLMPFLNECKLASEQAIKQSWPLFLELFYRLELMCNQARISDRVPADGVIPGDGEHWYFRAPGRPVIKSTQEYILQLEQ